MDQPAFRVGTNILVSCPECEAPSLANVVGEFPINIPKDGGPPSLYELAWCEKCGSALLVVEEDIGQGWEGPFVLWPRQQRPLSLLVPEELRREHEEARRCFEAKAYTATAVMVRRTLEGVCAQQGVQSGRATLHTMLQRLKDTGKIDGQLLEWSQALRVLGNEGAHYTGTAVSRDDAADALALAEALLDYLYVLSAQFSAFKERRAKQSEVDDIDS